MKRVLVLGAAALAFSFGALVLADGAAAAEKGERGAGLKKLLEDGGGKITKDAFIKFFEEKAKAKGKEGKGAKIAEKIFSKLDKNSDGVLDADELKAAKGEFKGKGKKKKAE